MAHATPDYHSHSGEFSHRHGFYKPHTSLGATGHWLNTAGLLVPLIIPEIIKDPARQWRVIRIASVATTLVSQGLWAHKVQKEREEARERCAERTN
jgi:hypothetical protein